MSFGVCERCGRTSEAGVRRYSLIVDGRRQYGGLLCPACLLRLLGRLGGWLAPVGRGRRLRR